MRLDGPRLPLTADETFKLALALNELTMNASKYGCFRDQFGRLEVTWRSASSGSDRRLGLEWREACRDGDIMAPETVGFGTRLIRMMIESGLRGTVERRFEPHGLHVRLTVPLAGPSCAQTPPTQAFTSGSPT